MKNLNVKERKKVLEKLELQLDYLNKRSENFIWYIFNNDLYELDKRLSNCVCWCGSNSIKNTHFDEENTDKLIVEFLDSDDESIILCPNDGGYI